MQVSDELKEALKKVALGFTSSVVVEEYLTIAEFEEKLKKDYGKDKKVKFADKDKTGENVKSCRTEGDGEVSQGDVRQNKVSKKSSCGKGLDIEDEGERVCEVSKPKTNRRERDKYRMICVKKKIDQKYHPPEVSGLKMLMEIEKDNEKSNIEKLVEDVRSMTMDELLEFRYKLLLDLNKYDDE